MLPGLDLTVVPSNTVNTPAQSNSDDHEDSIHTDDSQKQEDVNTTNDNNSNNGLLVDKDKEKETAPLHSAGPSADQLDAIRKMQQQRGLKRANSTYCGSVGCAGDIEQADESLIKNLTPRKGKAKIDKRITKIRYILDRYKQMKPEIELNHSFDFNRAFFEFIYNFFHVLAYPLLIYR